MKNSELSTRERMVQATCELLEAQGYHATGLNEILQRSDTPRGSLYYYFPDGKEELAEEAIERQGHSVECRLRNDMESHDDVAESVRSLFYRIAHFATVSGCRALGPITGVALESSTTNERLRQSCVHVYENWRSVLEEKLLGSGYSQTDAASLSLVILCAMEGATTIARTQRSPEPLQQMGDKMAQLIRTTQQSPSI